MTQLFMVHPGPLAEASAKTAPAADGVIIDQATAADAAALAELLTAAFVEDWTPDRVNDELLHATDVTTTWCLRQGGKIIATASERIQDIYPESGYVHWVAVSPAERGRRLGQLLTQRCLQGFVKRGLNRAVLKTDDFRASAVVTYLRLGFVPQSRSEEEERAWSGLLQKLFAAE